MDENLRSPEDELLTSDNLTHVMGMLETMDPREATVLRMRFGLDDKTRRRSRKSARSSA